VVTTTTAEIAYTHARFIPTLRLIQLPQRCS